MPRPYVHGYLVAGQPPAIDSTGLSPSLSPASGAIISTADDVADFYRALLTGHLVKPRLLRAMKKTRRAASPVDIPGQQYGLGLMRFPTPCGISWGHNGVLPGYFNVALSSADGRRQAVMMVNHDAASIPKAAARRIYPLVLKAFCSTR
jgi:D-alanyl-D-alanine carboxypeptidase